MFGKVLLIIIILFQKIRTVISSKTKYSKNGDFAKVENFGKVLITKQLHKNKRTNYKHTNFAFSCAIVIVAIAPELNLI